MADDDKPSKTASRVQRATLDADEQGEQSLTLIDALYDAAQDDAIEQASPPSAAAHRLVAAAHAMLDDLSRTSRGDRIVASSTRGSQEAASATRSVDAEVLAALTREELEQLVTRLQRKRGETLVVVYDTFTDDELRELARRLSPPRAR